MRKFLKEDAGIEFLCEACGFSEEECTCFLEMANLRKFDTGLPVNIELDTAKRWQRSGHARRVKFQSDRGDRANSFEFLSMSIEENPRVFNPLNKRIDLNQKEINKIKGWIRLNKDLLLKLADEEIEIDEFKRKMKKV